MSYQLSSDGQLVALPTVDIGGTNAAAVDATNWAVWHRVGDFDRITALLRVGPTWNAADDVDTCKLQQAQDASGAGAKDLTTSGSGLGYDTAAPVDAAGDEVILEARADQLDVDGGFQYVRLYVAETGNTGVDEVYGLLVLHSARYGYAGRHRDPVAGSVVYVTP